MRRARLFIILGCMATAACGREPLAASVDGFTVEPASLDFGTARTGHPKRRVLTLRNSAKSDRVVSIVIGAPFTGPTAVAIPAAGSLDIEVTFEPSAEGHVSAEAVLGVSGIAVSASLTGEGLKPLDCGSTDPCRVATYDAASDSCITAAADDGAECSSSCLESATCRGGVCVGLARSCNDGNSCTTDACGAGGCIHVPVACARSDNPCLAPSCDPVTGCREALVADGTPCAPVDCRYAYACVAGSCVARPHDSAPPLSSCIHEPQFSVGWGRVCALDGGVVACAGEGGEGELGDGRSVSSAKPIVAAGLADVVEVDTAMLVTCARVRDGRVACWGGNVLLPPPSYGSATPQFLDFIDSGAKVSLGSNFGCVLRQNRTVRCWGNTTYGQIGTPFEYRDDAWGISDIPLTDAIDVATNGASTCVLRADGSVWCVGSLVTEGQPIETSTPMRREGVEDAVAIGGGHGLMCALISSGLVRCWGGAEWPGSGLQYGTPLVQVPAPPVASMAIGAHSLVVTTRGGQRFGAGWVTALALGPAKFPDPNRESWIGFQRLPHLDGFDELQAAWGVGCGRRSGAMHCWGLNTSGQFGTGSVFAYGAPARSGF